MSTRNAFASAEQWFSNQQKKHLTVLFNGSRHAMRWHSFNILADIQPLIHFPWREHLLFFSLAWTTVYTVACSDTLQQGALPSPCRFMQPEGSCCFEFDETSVWTLWFIIPDMLCWSSAGRYWYLEWGRSLWVWFISVWVRVQTKVGRAIVSSLCNSIALIWGPYESPHAVRHAWCVGAPQK